MEKPNKTSNRDNFNLTIIFLTFLFPVIPVTLCFVFDLINEDQ